MVHDWELPIKTGLTPGQAYWPIVRGLEAAPGMSMFSEKALRGIAEIVCNALPVEKEIDNED